MANTDGSNHMTFWAVRGKVGGESVVAPPENLLGKYIHIPATLDYFVVSLHESPPSRSVSRQGGASKFHPLIYIHILKYKFHSFSIYELKFSTLHSLHAGTNVAFGVAWCDFTGSLRPVIRKSEGSFTNLHSRAECVPWKNHGLAGDIA